MMKRVHKFREVLKYKNVDGFIVSKPENRYYLSGFTGSNAMLLITLEHSYLITDFRYIEQANKTVKGYQVIRQKGLIENTLADLVKKLGLKNLGFESEDVSYQQYLTLTDNLPQINLVPLRDTVERIRWIKDESEINLLKKAAEITDLTFKYILEFIKPGVRESEIALEMEYFMKKQGASKSAFETIVASGYRASLPHGVASNKKIAEGEFIVIDFGAVFEGYHSDMTRTVFLGKPDEKHKEIYNLVLKAQTESLKVIRSGVKCSFVDTVARDIITIKGYGANFGHSLGHSVGLEIHEKPAFAPQDDTVLEPGMTLTVEPGIYISGWGGVRIEDLGVVTRDGFELISHSPKSLIEL